MRPGPTQIDAATLRAITDAAIAEGRHSETSRHLCTACRRWCDGIYHVADGGGQGISGRVQYCRACAVAAGFVAGRVEPRDRREERHG
jgi:hypothetical protein